MLTTTLAPGVTFLSSAVTLDGNTSAQLPDQSGQNLAWSLGTIQGYDRESVAVTVSLAESDPTAARLGRERVRHARRRCRLGHHARRDAATRQYLRPEPARLDARRQHERPVHPGRGGGARLRPDADLQLPAHPDRLQLVPGLGPRRAGNALVERRQRARRRQPGRGPDARLGHPGAVRLGHAVAERGPGADPVDVPGDQYQTVGYIPAGTQVSDPANDPQLLAETESHYWFQFDTGSGMQDADPLMPGATIGQTFTTSTGTFTAVPDDLEETTEVQLVAEITSAGLLGSSSNDTTVLDQTFDDVELVGRPLTFGNFVSSQSTGFIIAATTYTYTPYVDIGDDANPNPTQDETITGTPYQEVFSNFPFVSSEVTGLFLNVTLSGPQGPAQTYQKTLFDGIGYAVRQNGGTPEGSGQPAGSPSINPLQVWSLAATPGLQDPDPVQLIEDAANAAYTTMANQVADGQSQQAQATSLDALTAATRADLAALVATSDDDTAVLAASALVAAYAARPRITVVSASLAASGRRMRHSRC